MVSVVVVSEEEERPLRQPSEAPCVALPSCAGATRKMKTATRSKTVPIAVPIAVLQGVVGGKDLLRGARGEEEEEEEEEEQQQTLEVAPKRGRRHTVATAATAAAVVPASIAMMMMMMAMVVATTMVVTPTRSSTCPMRSR